ncbi:MAG: hypothetical protein B6I19_03585 [Bacteroidetes bacterium 4572_114]|nr:MAG: hypothetical protein B6I19_03585 [Bacteroidetes bacterium 4572_114]
MKEAKRNLKPVDEGFKSLTKGKGWKPWLGSFSARAAIPSYLRDCIPSTVKPETSNLKPKT